jgi:hypothetical protein
MLLDEDKYINQYCIMKEKNKEKTPCLTYMSLTLNVHDEALALNIIFARPYISPTP